MAKLNEDVSAFLNKTGVWVFATCQDKPNAAPIFFKKVASPDTLVLFDVFMNKNLANLKKNKQVSIVAYDPKSLEGYQVKGTAEYSTDAALVAEGNAISTKLNLPTKGAVVIKVAEIYVQTPGPNIGKQL